MKKILAIVLCLVMVLSLLPTVSFAADEQFIELTEGVLLDGAYSTDTKSKNVSGVTFEYIQLGAYGNGIQMRINNGSASTLYNTTAIPGSITKIVLEHNSGKAPKDQSNAFEFSFGSSASSLTEVVMLNSVKGTYTYTITPTESNHTFFKMVKKQSTTAYYWTSIKIYYTDNAHTHVWNDGEVTTPATCTTAGVKTFTCTKDSSHTKTEEIPALGHNFGADGKCGNTGCTAEGFTAVKVDALKDGMKVVIFNPANNAAATNNEYLYEGSSSSKLELETVFGNVKGNILHVLNGAGVLTVKIVDGHYSFVNADGKYLYTDGTDVKFVNEAGEYTIFDLEESTDGFFIKSVNAVYNDMAQYLELYKGYLTVFQKYADSDAKIYTFQFFCTHANQETTGDKTPTCEEAGATGDVTCKDCGTKLSTSQPIDANGHKGELTWVEQGEGHIQKYGVCGCTVGEVEDHDHAGENGVCSKCGHGCEHTGGTATCDKQAVCEKCNNPYGEVDKTNHSGETELKNDKEATCGAAGYTGDTYCKGCGEKLEDGKEIPATGKHVDEGKDHKCDVCEAPVGEHKAAEGSHKCGYCGETLSQCADTDKDGKCDICGTAMETKPDDKDDTKPDDKEDDKKDDKPVTDPNSITAKLVTSLKDGMHIIIYNPGDGVINTGVEYEYVNSKTGKSKWELKTAAATVNGKTLTAAKADACILTVKRVNGHYSFVNADGKYLYMDTNDVKFVDKAGDYTLFDLEKAEGGFFIKSVNAVYTSTDKETNETIKKPQYLELYSGCLTVYSMNSSNPKLYTFQFYTTDEVNSESGDPIAMVLGLMAVSGLGITVLKKKEH